MREPSPLDARGFPLLPIGKTSTQEEVGMNYGYARCSTNETKQDINRQVRELKEAGAEEIFL